MTAVEILYNLGPYQIFLEELYQKLSKENTSVIWKRSLDIQYDHITLQVEYGVNKEHLLQTAVKIKFEITNKVVLLKDVHTNEPEKKEPLQKLIKENKAIHESHWHTQPNNTWYHNEKITAYINMADAIATAGSHCGAGDSYRPGNFSEIKVDEMGIVLSQVNLHNSRSADHKDNYHMRKLHFYIPLLKREKENIGLEENYQIGEMQITFSDHSSQANKGCGEKIVEQILQQKADFEK